MPKRATNEPITPGVTRSLYQEFPFGGTVDLGRRFGSEGQFGIRANATCTGRQYAVNNQTGRPAHAHLGLDLRGDPTGFGATSVSYRTIRRIQGGVVVAAGVQRPGARPIPTRTYCHPGTSAANDLFVALRVEATSRRLTGYIAVGTKHGCNGLRSGLPTIVNVAATPTVPRFYSRPTPR